MSVISRPCNLTPATWTVLISIALVNSLLKRARYDCEQFQSEVDKPSSQDMKVEKLSLLVVKKKKAYKQCDGKQLWVGICFIALDHGMHLDPHQRTLKQLQMQMCGMSSSFKVTHVSMKITLIFNVE